MRRGQRPSAEQVVLMLRQIEVQAAQGKSIALACKEADISEQKLRDECLRQEIFHSLKEAQTVRGLSGIPCRGGGLNIRPPWLG